MLDEPIDLLRTDLLRYPGEVRPIIVDGGRSALRPYVIPGSPAEQEAPEPEHPPGTRWWLLSTRSSSDNSSSYKTASIFIALPQTEIGSTASDEIITGLSAAKWTEAWIPPTVRPRFRVR